MLRYVKPVLKRFIVDKRVWMNSYIRIHRHPNWPDIWSSLASTLFRLDGILRYVSFKVKQNLFTWVAVMFKFKRFNVKSFLVRGLRYFKMVIFCVLMALMVHKYLLGEYLLNFWASVLIVTFWRKLLIFLLAWLFCLLFLSFFFRFLKAFLLVALIFFWFLFLTDFFLRLSRFLRN